jgi:hypothetical protein
MQTMCPENWAYEKNFCEWTPTNDFRISNEQKCSNHFIKVMLINSYSSCSKWSTFLGARSVTGELLRMPARGFLIISEVLPWLYFQALVNRIFLHVIRERSVAHGDVCGLPRPTHRSRKLVFRQNRKFGQNLRGSWRNHICWCVRYPAATSVTPSTSETTDERTTRGTPPLSALT